MTMNTATLLEAVQFEAVKNNMNTRKKELQNIATIHGVEASVLQAVYRAIQMVQGVELKSGWNDTESAALVKMVSKLEGIVAKGKVYEFFGTLVNRTGNSVQQQYSKLVREMQKQDPVNHVHMKEGEVEHNAPQLENPKKGLVDALVDMFDACDEHGYNSEQAIVTAANGMKLALEVQKETGKPLRMDFTKESQENRELKQKVADLEFQYEEITKAFSIMKKKLEKEQEVSNSLRGEIWNLNALTGVDQIRQLQKMKYVVDKDGGVVLTKKAK